MPGGTPYPIGSASSDAAAATLVITVGTLQAGSGASGTTAGDVIVVGCSVNSASETISSVHDSRGNTYAPAKGQASAGTYTDAIYVALNTVALSVNAGDTITVTYSSASANGKCAAALGCSGIAASSAVDVGVSAISGGTPTANPTVATGTLAQASELIVGWTDSQAGGGAPSWNTPMAGVCAGFQAPGGNQYSALGATVVGATSSVTVNSTLSASERWVIIAVSLKSTLPAVTTTSLPGGTVGGTYGQVLSVAGGVSPYTWSISAGSLPAGLTLSSSGVISGTPTVAGTGSFTAEVTDSASNSGTRGLSITVAGTTTSPIYQPPAGYCYFGAYPGGGNADPDIANGFESPAMADRQLAMWTRYYEVTSTWPSADDVSLMSAGRLMYADLTPSFTIGDITWAQIAAGTYDSYLQAAATAIKTAGYPVFLGWDAEPDDTQREPSGTASDYIASYRHVYEIFKTTCGDLAVMCWIVSEGDSYSQTFYPGDSYVDWIGVDPYDPTLSKGTPAITYQPFLTWLGEQSFGAGKPIGIFETGVDAPSSSNSVTDAARQAWIDKVPAAVSGLGYQIWTWFNSVGSLDGAPATITIAPGSLAATGLATIGANAVFNPPASAPPSTPYLIGSASGDAASATLVISVGETTNTGDGVAVGATINSASATVTGVTDSRSNTYALAVSNSGSAEYGNAIYVALSTTQLVAGTDTITVTYSSALADGKTAAATGIPSAAASGAVDAAVSATSTGSTAPSVATGTLAQTSEALIAWESNAAAGGAIAWGASFIQQVAAFQAAGGNQYSSMAASVVSSQAPVTAAGTITTAKSAILLISLKLTTSPVITTGSLPGAYTGDAYSQVLTVSGGISPFAWSISAGSLPAGYSLASATGVITGTTTTAGTSSFTVKVTDSASNTATKALSIVVASNVSVVTTSLPGGTEGTAYSQALTATGGSTVYTWSVSAGSLPAGLTLGSSTGIISGTPATAGTASFTAEVTDSASNTATQALSIVVATNLAVVTTSLPGGLEGVAYSQSLAASGGTSPYTWSVISGSLPAGLSLSSATISGTPTGTGTSPFTVQVTDSLSNTATQALSITVLSGLTITTTSLPGGTTGVPYSETLAATAGTPPYTWSVSAGRLPPGLGLSSSGVISGTPVLAGSFAFTAEVTDSLGNTATTALPVTVSGPVFPAAPLDVAVAVSLTAGKWTDVTTYAYNRDSPSPAITIARGRPNEASQVAPSSARLLLNNRDGRFTAENPAGPYYGQLGRNTPLRISVPDSGTYLRMEDDTTSYVSCPDASGLHITGSIDMRLDLNLSGYAPATLASKWVAAGSERSWALVLNGDGTLTFSWTTDGTLGTLTQAQSTVPVPPGRTVLRAALTASSGTVTFYTAAAGDASAGPFTQLGQAVVLGSTSVFSSTAPVAIGYAAGITADFAGTGGPTGQFFEYQLRNSGGTAVAHPVFSAQGEGTTSFADGQGNTWTLAGTSGTSGRSYRYHGEMSSSPKAQDPSGNDVWVPLTCGGILRRLQQGNAPEWSPIRRAVQQQSGSLTPVIYWPCEDLAGALQVAADPGGPAMTFSGTPQLSSDTSFACSAALPQLNGAIFSGTVPGYSAGPYIVARFLLHLPSPPETFPILVPLQFSATGTAATVSVAAVGAGGLTPGALELQALDPTGAVLFTSPGTAGYSGQDIMVSAELTTSGTFLAWSLSVLVAGSDVPETLSGIAGAGVSIGAVTGCTVNAGGAMKDSGFGHLQFQSALTPLAGFASPLAAWAGETAGNRFTRLCAENSVPSRVYGPPDVSAAMGPQPVDTLPDLLQQCEDADRGMIYDPRSSYALGYRTLASLCNQAQAVAIAYTGELTNEGFQPATDDDQYTVNDATVERASGGSSADSGSSLQWMLDDGSPMSVSAPPAGAGDYASSYQLNLQYDTQLPDVAGWIVHVGTVNDARYPAIPVNLARPEVTALYYVLQDVNIGDYLAVTDPPFWLTPNLIRQLAAGTTEEIGGMIWRITWNGIPEVPYETGLYDDPVYGLASTDGSTLHTAVSATATSLSIATANAGSPLWDTTGASTPFDINLGGERMTVTSITGSSSPQAFTVTRSVNGVVKSQAAGQQVTQFFLPVYAIA